jgi:hypothetical protein
MRETRGSAADRGLSWDSHGLRRGQTAARRRRPSRRDGGGPHGADGYFTTQSWSGGPLAPTPAGSAPSRRTGAGGWRETLANRVRIRPEIGATPSVFGSMGARLVVLATRRRRDAAVPAAGTAAVHMRQPLPARAGRGLERRATRARARRAGTVSGLPRRSARCRRS